MFINIRKNIVTVVAKLALPKKCVAQVFRPANISRTEVLRYMVWQSKLCNYNLRIRKAAHAAPKPLSMFTTVIPSEHELSMARSGVMPEKLEP